MKASQPPVLTLKGRKKEKSVVCLSPRYCLPLVAKFLRQTHAWLETCLRQRRTKKTRKRERVKKKLFQ